MGLHCCPSGATWSCHCKQVCCTTACVGMLMDCRFILKGYGCFRCLPHMLVSTARASLPLPGTSTHADACQVSLAASLDCAMALHTIAVQDFPSCCSLVHVCQMFKKIPLSAHLSQTSNKWLGMTRIRLSSHNPTTMPKTSWHVGPHGLGANHEAFFLMVNVRV